MKLKVVKMTKGGYRVIKGIGGGVPGQKIILAYFEANFMYFHLLFTEMENFHSFAQKWAISGGW